MFELGRPARGVRLEVSSGWARPRTDHMHKSIDIPMPVGTVLQACDAGEIIVADRTDNSDAGRWVGVRHRSGLVTRYMHMSVVDVDVGDQVARGARLGLSGNTGTSSGPHLHLNGLVPWAMLSDVAEDLGGVPRSGWGSPHWNELYSIPLEPYVPVDGYREIVVAEAFDQGIPLYRPRRRRELAVAVAAIAVGVLAHLLLG